MLNKNGERELAYVVKIDAIEPIVGSDNCEAAIVGGWRVMVRKGTFEPNDLAIYFEIDSKVDTTKPEFAFLEKKGGKIKTQRYTFGGKGLMISQGLLMAPEDFGWRFIKDSAYAGEPCIVKDFAKTNVIFATGESRFLTKELGVTYAEEEDNSRKAASADKYKKMAGRHPNLFKKPWARWMMKREWGRKVMFFFFGKKKDKKTGWPAWVTKTDEERCLPGGTKILTDRGWIQINKLVNHKMDVKVASVNEDGTISYKKILDYQKFNNTTPMVTIKYPYRVGVSRMSALCCTEDHKCLTERGYVEAKDITISDKIFSPTESYGKDSLSPIYGMLLGDSHIVNDKRSRGLLRVIATNGEKQLEYLKYKRSLFDDGKIVNSGIGSYGKKPCYHWFMEVDPYISENIKNDWYANGSKTLTDNVINKINDISLAFWYMDDGCVSYRNKDKTSYFVRLATQGFSLGENEKLCSMLCDKFNIKAKVNKDKIAKDGHQMYRIDISSSDEADKFFKLISPYVCDSMLYKLPDKWRDRELIKLHYKKTYKVVPIPVLSVNAGQTKNKTWGQNFSIVYDIEVEDNHNFIADNVVVHNCQNMPWILNDKSPWIATEKIDGTSTTFTMKRGKKRIFGRDKNEFYVCSRNVVFDKPDQKCFYASNVYLEMADKYKIEQFLESFLNCEPDVEWVTLQGETFGEGIQKRDYSLKCHEFMGFNLIDSKRGRWNSVEAKDLCATAGIPWVPIISVDFILPDTVDELLTIATGESVCDHGMREGLVFRSQDGVKSFKAVSNEFLLKYHNG